MAGLLNKITAFARSPRGQQLVGRATQKAQQLSKDPATQARLRRLREQVTKRTSNRSQGGPGTPGGR